MFPTIASMKPKPSFKILMFTSIAVIAFLFAFSPTALATSSSAGVSSTSSVPSVNPTATSPLGDIVNTTRVLASTGSPNAAGKCGACTFVTNLGNGYVQVLSSAGKLITSIDDGGCSGYGVTYATSTKLIYVFDYSCSTVYVINPATLKVVNSYSCTGCIFGAYVPTNQMIYVALFGYSEVVPFNPSTGALGTPITVCAAYPEYIAYNAVDGNVYVPARNGCYSIIDPSTNTATIVSIGTYPNGVACTTSGKTALCWITDEDNGSVYEVSGSKLLHTITDCTGCYWGDVFSPANKEVYVTASDGVCIIKGTKLLKCITESGASVDCYGAARTIVTTFVNSTSSYAIGINKKDSIAWITNLGADAKDPESCAAS